MTESHQGNDEARPAGEPTLNAMLSLNSVVRTSSPFACQENAVDTSTAQFYEIGKGSVGKIFAHPGSTTCFKMLMLHASPKMENQYRMHQRVQAAFEVARQQMSVAVRVPGIVSYITPDDDQFWEKNLSRFDFDETFPEKKRETVVMERIFPLPKTIRDQLIDRYCRLDKNMAKAQKSNEDCLLRPILGRRRFSTQPGRFAFSLRNFKLHLDQIEELGLSPLDYALPMAEALAIFHTVAKVDGHDIEYVLGSAPTSKELGQQESQDTRKEAYLDFSLRSTRMYVLDFDDCAPIEHDDAGLQAAIRGFTDNVPYYPRPSADTSVLWKRFCDRYKDVSVALGGNLTWAERFVTGVEEDFKRKHEQMTPIRGKRGRRESVSSSPISPSPCSKASKSHIYGASWRR